VAGSSHEQRQDPAGLMLQLHRTSLAAEIAGIDIELEEAEAHDTGLLHAILH